MSRVDVVCTLEPQPRPGAPAHAGVGASDGTGAARSVPGGGRRLGEGAQVSLHLAVSGGQAQVRDTGPPDGPEGRAGEETPSQASGGGRGRDGDLGLS